MNEEVKLNDEDKGILQEYRDLKLQEDKIKAKKAELEPYVIEIMEEFGLKNVEHGDLKVSYVPESVTHSFDSTKFKKENPETVERYQKESTRKAHVRAKLG